IGVSKDALTHKFNKTTTAETAPKRRIKTQPQPLNKKTVEDKKAQDHFLSLMLMQPQLRTYLDLVTTEMLYEEDAEKLLEFLKAHPDWGGTPTLVQGLAECAKILSLQFEELYQGLELTELRYEAARLQARLVEHFVKTKKQSIAEQLENADEATTQTLLTEVKKLDNLLNNVKGR
ncbi:MAG TPA: hypothetical protein V6C72_19870, partial [Chroococcales cyanobacterium]